MVEFVLRQERFDARLLFGGDAADDEILIGGEAEVAGVDFGDFAQSGFGREVVGVAQAAVLDEERVVPASVGAFGPTIAIAGAGEFEGAGFAEFPAEAGFEFGFEPVDTAVLDGVFEAGVFAVGAVAEIALDGDDGLRDLDDFFAREVADDIGQAGIRLGIAVRHAEAAADGEVVADEFFVLADGDEAEVLGVDIDVVAGRDGEACFEFARQIRFAVERFFFGIGGDFFAVEPDFVVGAGAGGEVGVDGTSVIEHGGVQGGLPRVRVGHDVAVHVAAGRDAVQDGIIDPLHGRLEDVLGDEVELEGLAGGEFEGVAAVAVGQRVDLEPLFRRADAAGDADADHEDEGFFEPGLFAFDALVAVVLLVDAVELGNVRVLVGNGAGGAVFEAGGEGAAQEVAGVFDTLDFGGRFGIGGVGDHV